MADELRIIASKPRSDETFSDEEFEEIRKKRLGLTILKEEK